MSRIATIIGILHILNATLACAAPIHCNVRQNIVHHGYKAQAFHHQAAQVLYLVAPEIRYEAIVEKKLREHPDYESFKQFQAFKAAQQVEAKDQWKSLATGQPVAGSLPDGTPDLAIKKFCAGCHGAARQEAGLRLDGTAGIDSDSFRAFYRMASQGIGIKPEMSGVLKRMTPEQTQQVLDELSALEIPATSSDSEPEDEPGVLK